MNQKAMMTKPPDEPTTTSPLRLVVNGEKSRNELDAIAAVEVSIADGQEALREVMGHRGSRTRQSAPFSGLTSREIELLADGLRALSVMSGDELLVYDLLERLDVAQATLR